MTPCGVPLFYPSALPHHHCTIHAHNLTGLKLYAIDNAPRFGLVALTAQQKEGDGTCGATRVFNPPTMEPLREYLYEYVAKR